MQRPETLRAAIAGSRASLFSRYQTVPLSAMGRALDADLSGRNVLLRTKALLRDIRGRIIYVLLILFFSIPNFFILELSVETFISSFSAAPPGPYTFQLQFFNVAII